MMKLFKEVVALNQHQSCPSPLKNVQIKLPWLAQQNVHRDYFSRSIGLRASWQPLDTTQPKWQGINEEAMNSFCVQLSSPLQTRGRFKSHSVSYEKCHLKLNPLCLCALCLFFTFSAGLLKFARLCACFSFLLLWLRHWQHRVSVCTGGGRRRIPQAD